jgi:rhodanese-related sulfurtransferase
MCKFARFFFALLIVAMLIVVPGLAQEATPEVEVDVLADIVMPRLEEYGAELPEKYGTLSLDAFLEMLAETEDIVILDVREVKEIEEFGIIEDAIHVPLRTLGENINLMPDLDATIVVVCKGGFRATIAMTTLHVLGYMNAKVLIGGFDAWTGEELPVVEAATEAEAAEVPESIDPLLLEYVAAYLANLPEGWGAVKPADFFEESFDALPDLLLDVRSDEEWADPGYIEGATHIWIDEFVANLDQLPKELDSSIVVYCATSYRAGVVATMLGMMGYEDVRNISGGIKGWIAAELPVIKE